MLLCMREKLRYLLLLLFCRFVAQRTNKLIENMFTEPVPVDSKLVLSTALYFNGEGGPSHLPHMWRSDHLFFSNLGPFHWPLTSPIPGSLFTGLSQVLTMGLYSLACHKSYLWGPIHWPLTSPISGALFTDISPYPSDIIH